MVVPSRGRPGNIARLRDSMSETCTGDTTLIVGLDADDITRGSYPADVVYEVRDGIRKVTAWCNELAVPRAKDYRYIGHFGDDNVPRTPSWDTRIMAALEHTPFAFANDQYPSRQPGTLSCHIFMRSEVVEALGYFGPPSIAHMFVDVAWMAWGTACGITYLNDVLIPHLHYTSGGSAHDATYATSLAGTAADLEAWLAYCSSGELNKDIRKLGGRPFSKDAITQFNWDLNIPAHW